MLRMSLMGLGAMSPLDEMLYWLGTGPRDDWNVVVATADLPIGTSHYDDKRRLVYIGAPLYTAVAAALAGLGRAFALGPAPSDVTPAIAAAGSMGRVGDVRTAIQLAIANPIKPPTTAAPAQPPASAPLPPTVPVVPASAPTPPSPVVPLPATPPAPAPAAQVTPASTANAIVQSGNAAPPVAPDPAMQYSATTAITPPSSTLRWVLLGVLALGGIGGGAYYFIKKRKAAKTHA